MYRTHQHFLGGTTEWLLGGRYLQFNDKFFAIGGLWFGNSTTVPPTDVSTTFWNTDVKNTIGGPELGMRWYRPMGRFAISAEGRFTAGINTETIHQDSIIGMGLGPDPTATTRPGQLTETSYNHSANFTEFTPIVELRVEGHMQLTRMISLKVGWTGMWMDNVARASEMIDYTAADDGHHHALSRRPDERAHPGPERRLRA